MANWKRALTPAEAALVQQARHTAHELYAGRTTPHRSCGIALAETFGCATPAYQSLRKGGITGMGECGAIVAGRLVLGELLGDPDPTGPVTAALRAAATDYEQRVRGRIERGAAPGDAIVCNTLVGQFPDFAGPARADFCTSLAATVAELVAEVMVRSGHTPPVKVLSGRASPG